MGVNGMDMKLGFLILKINGKKDLLGECTKYFAVSNTVQDYVKNLEFLVICLATLLFE